MSQAVIVRAEDSSDRYPFLVFELDGWDGSRHLVARWSTEAVAQEFCARHGLIVNS